MKYPTLYEEDTTRQMIDVFRGYNHNLRIGDGEFYDMTNMTGDCYPVLSPRKSRAVHAQPLRVNGLIAKDALCHIDGSNFVINGYPVDMDLNDEPKQLVSMGAYVIIMPDKKYINTLDLTDFGNMEAVFTTSQDTTFSLCTMEGAEYENVAASAEEPSEPENLAYWIDTSTEPHALKQYSANSASWVSVATTYIKIASAGIGKAFSQYDGVNISGIKAEVLQDLNGSAVIWAKGDDYIVVVGIVDAVTAQEIADGAITVARRLPAMDFVIESRNRLWGCRYGVANNGQVVNEIYASKLGDFKNWECFMSLSTDSYVASCGTDGPFTGAITHMGYPLFFKENCVHKVYGNYPANFQIQDTACRGVQKGCHRSLAIVNEVLYYKSISGVCAYDGSLPVEVSGDLGDMHYGRAVAGAHGNKYYISMQEAVSTTYHLFVYDTAKGMWHREDGLQAEAFCSCDGRMYCMAGGKILVFDAGEETVEWMVQTGEIGLNTPDMKYISRLTLRMAQEAGSQVRVWVQYDLQDSWQMIFSMTGSAFRSFSVPIRPMRCDYMRLRIEGKGRVKLYAITKTIEQGSELS